MTRLFSSMTPSVSSISRVLRSDAGALERVAHEIHHTFLAELDRRQVDRKPEIRRKPGIDPGTVLA